MILPVFSIFARKHEYLGDGFDDFERNLSPDDGTGFDDTMIFLSCFD